METREGKHEGKRGVTHEVKREGKREGKRGVTCEASAAGAEGVSELDF